MAARYLKRLFLIGLTTVVLAATAFADHRPGNVVVVGGTLALSGRYVEPAGHHMNARKLYVEELNGRGGLLRHKVELRILDDRSDTRTAIESYDKLISEGNVDLLLGPYSSAITDAVANVMEARKWPFMAPGSSSRAIWERGRKYVFSIPRAVAQDYQQGALHIAKEIGVKRIAILGEGSLFGRQSTQGTLEWAKKLDLEVLLVQSYHKDEKDFTALLRRIADSGAEAIFSNSHFDDSVAQLRQMHELGINVRMFAATVGPASSKFVEELGPSAEFVLGSSRWEPKPVLGHPGMAEFIANYEKLYSEEPNYHAASAYAEMQILEAAVKDAASFDPQKVRDALASIALKTIVGSYKVDAQGLSPIEGLTFQIQNGKRVIVWPKHMAEANYILPMPKWNERTKN